MDRRIKTQVDTIHLVSQKMISLQNKIVSRMVRNKVIVVPEHVYLGVRQVGCNYADEGDQEHACEIWDTIAYWEYRVLVYYNSVWLPGTCQATSLDHTFEHAFDLDAEITYTVRVEEPPLLLQHVDRGRVIIKSDELLLLQNVAKQARHDLQDLVKLKDDIAATERRTGGEAQVLRQQQQWADRLRVISEGMRPTGASKPTDVKKEPTLADDEPGGAKPGSPSESPPFISPSESPPSEVARPTKAQQAGERKALVLEKFKASVKMEPMDDDEETVPEGEDDVAEPAQTQQEADQPDVADPEQTWFVDQYGIRHGWGPAGPEWNSASTPTPK